MQQKKKIPTIEGTVDIFTSNKDTSEEIQDHRDLVWDKSSFGVDTPKYFAKFGAAPTDG